jgi:hypothetical protein
MSTEERKPGKPTTDRLREDIHDLEDMIRDISAKVNSAAVLNGGFNELADEVRQIRLTQKVIETTMPQLKDDVMVIRNAIYDPKEGIYARLRDSQIDSLKQETMWVEVDRKLTSLENKIGPIEQSNKRLMETAGTNLEELAAIVKTRKTIDRIQWILLTALATGGAKFLWDMLSERL